MKCHLCDREISGYSELANHLKIDERHEFDICSDCIRKFAGWQRDNLARLFPTSRAKRRRLNDAE